MRERGNIDSIENSATIRTSHPCAHAFTLHATVSNWFVENKWPKICLTFQLYFVYYMSALWSTTNGNQNSMNAKSKKKNMLLFCGKCVLFVLEIGISTKINSKWQQKKKTELVLSTYLPSVITALSCRIGMSERVSEWAKNIHILLFDICSPVRIERLGPYGMEYTIRISIQMFNGVSIVGSGRFGSTKFTTMKSEEKECEYVLCVVLAPLTDSNNPHSNIN